MGLEACAREIGVSRPTLYARHPRPAAVRLVRDWLHRKVHEAAVRREVDASLAQLLAVAHLQDAGLPIDAAAYPAVRTALDLPPREAAVMLTALEMTWCGLDHTAAVRTGQYAILKHLALGRYRRATALVNHLLDHHSSALTEVEHVRLLVVRGAARFRSAESEADFVRACNEAWTDLSEAKRIRDTSYPEANWRLEAHPEHYLGRLQSARYLHDRHRHRGAHADALGWFREARWWHSQERNDAWLGRDYLWEADLHRQSGDIAAARRLLAEAERLVGPTGSAVGWVRWQRLAMAMETERHTVKWAFDQADQIIRHWVEVGYAAGVPRVLVQVAEWLLLGGHLDRARRAVVGALCLSLEPDRALGSPMRRLRLTRWRDEETVRRQAEALVKAADNLAWPFSHVERFGLSPVLRTKEALARHDVLGRPVLLEPELPRQEVEVD